jgi:hypothetical protein
MHNVELHLGLCQFNITCLKFEVLAAIRIV